jgi:hypothetical protein
MRNAGAFVFIAAMLQVVPRVGAAQTRPDPPCPCSGGGTVTVVPAPKYEAGPLRRGLLGNGWRDVWTTPVEVQVFDFGTYAGGVEWTERGGGEQSITLHLREVDGWREYNFRSVDKFPRRAQVPELKETLAGFAFGDLVSVHFPAAALMVAPILEAVGVLHVQPVLQIMPDDPRLGVYRDTMAGMLATVEDIPNEAPGDRPGFAGSPKIKGTDAFFDDLDESKAHRLDERLLLTARLVDFVINDTDRTRDNMRWARYGEEGDYRWQPLPIDRDWAFVNAEGWVVAAVRPFFPKLVAFGPDFPSLGALTFSSHLLDRRLLQRLTRLDFQQVADEVRGAVDDSVIETAIAELPEGWRRETDATERLRAGIRGRRDRLPALAMEFYELLATEVDVYGTDEVERATVQRFADGRVRVTLTWPEQHDRAGEAFYDRTFLPAETREVRLHLLDGDDRVKVSGDPSRQIVVRIVGGKGDDVVEDEAGGGATSVYDAHGENLLQGGGRIATKEWDAPEPREGLRLGSAWAPDWGGGMGWSAAVDYGEVAGVVAGFGPTWTRYGFRRLPYHWRADVRLLYAAGAGSVGAELGLDYRLENSPRALTLDVRAVPYDAFHFHGLGNASSNAGAKSLVPQDRVAIRPAATWHIGWRAREDEPGITDSDEERGQKGLRPLVGRLDLGPQFVWTAPRPATAAPFASTVGEGDRDLFRSGARVALELDRTDQNAAPRRGWRFRGSAAGFLAAGGVRRPFTQAEAAATAYLPLPVRESLLAFRLGGSAVSGAAPPQDTRWVGGRTTLRGHGWQRYRGDVAAFGSSELRVPVTDVQLLVRWNMGLFGLADAGRVWVGGQSPGGWHTGFGGGLWLDALGQVVSAAYAHGEEGRFYVQLGLSY